ncbi:MAG: SusC/RagA family TonB-linked outer membrane protein [Bacteroidales bacterium]
MRYLIFGLLLFTLVAGTCSPALLAQETDRITVSGKVVSIESGESLGEITVSVLQVPGLQATTDSTGAFEINVPDKNVTLVFSFPGFNPQEVPLGGRTTILVQMVRSGQLSLSETIPLTYRTKKNRDLTESVAWIPEGLLRQQAAGSLESMIQGLATGAHVTRSSGFPGSGAEVYIRGASSIHTGHKPLYIIDGFILKSDIFENTLSLGTPYNPLVDISPEDIESITVLKDGYASSLYGTRAANGIVLINTYQGSQGASTLDLNTHAGVTMEPEFLPLLDAEGYRDLFSELGFPGDLTPQQINNTYARLLDPEPGERMNNNTNWQDEIFKPAFTHNHHLRLKGGDGISKYMFTVGYTDKDGIIDNTYLRRLTSRFNLDYQISSKLTFSSRISYTNTNIRAHDQGASIYNPVTLATTKSPIFEPYNLEHLSHPLDSADLTGKSNPIAVIEGLENTNIVNRFIGTVSAGYDFSTALKLRTTFGMDYFRLRENRFIPSEGIARYKNRINQTSLQISKEHMFTNETILKFNKLFSHVHRLGFVLGAAIQTNEFQTDYGSAINTPSDEFTSLGSGAKMDSITYQGGKWNTLSYFGNADYSYNDRYFLSANLRIDGSSRFGQNNRLGYFPGVAVAWKLSSEPFLYGLNRVNLLKIRASYGISGSDNIGYYNSLAFYIPANYQLMGGYRPGNLRNPDLRWEQTAQLDVGIDFSVFSQRINLRVDYYVKTTTDLLTYERIPWESGYDYRIVNMGKIGNRGIEIGLEARILTGALRWDLGLNLSRNRNTIVELPDGDVIRNYGIFEGIAREGESLGAIYGYRVTGIYQSEEEIQLDNTGVDPSGYGYQPFQPGDLVFEDINGDGEIDERDKTIIGNTAPDFFGGIHSTWSFRGFRLFTMASYVYGNEVVDGLGAILHSMSGYDNQSAEVLGRWMQTGDDTDIPRAALGDPPGNARMSTRWVEDGSYLRLKTLTLSYSLSDAVIDRIFLRKLTVYVSGQNLLTLGRFQGYDPEFSTQQDALTAGLYYAGFPITRLFLVGARFGF